MVGRSGCRSGEQQLLAAHLELGHFALTGQYRSNAVHIGLNGRIDGLNQLDAEVVGGAVGDFPCIQIDALEGEGAFFAFVEAADGSYGYFDEVVFAGCQRGAVSPRYGFAQRTAEGQNDCVHGEFSRVDHHAESVGNFCVR